VEPSAVRDLLVCPSCRSGLDWRRLMAQCRECSRCYLIKDGIPMFAVDLDRHKSQQVDFFDNADAEFETTRPRFAPRLYGWLVEEKYRRSVASLRDEVSWSTVLNVCGGSGMDAEFLASEASAAVVLADISPSAARRARERARRFGFDLTAIVADAEALPFDDRSIDLVYVHDGLHHLRRPEIGLAEMARVAARAVSVNEPVRAAATHLAVRLGLSETVEEAGNRIERVDPTALCHILERNGFRILEARRYAMLYRHHPGPAMRLFSSSPLLPIGRTAVKGFNAIIGSIGNKVTIQATR
jgi:ubiquinone/menaquinone biosynthesis C-methylase UbiE/uncharacterized protein YbaR (Trm112 family)